MFILLRHRRVIMFIINIWLYCALTVHIWNQLKLHPYILPATAGYFPENLFKRCHFRCWCLCSIECISNSTEMYSLLLKPHELTWISRLSILLQEMLSHSLGDSPTLWGFDLFLPPASTVWPSTDGQQCSIKKHVARHKRCIAALFRAKMMKNSRCLKWNTNGRCVYLYEQSFIWPYMSFIHLIINIHYIYRSKQRRPCPCLAILQ